MKIKSAAKYLRIGPKKVRIILPFVKNKKASQAVEILENMNQKAAQFILKVLKSGLNNAEQKKLDIEKLVISDIRVDGGPSYKRVMPRAMGRADVILRRTSHLTLQLEEAAQAETPETKTETKTKKKTKKVKEKVGR